MTSTQAPVVLELTDVSLEFKSAKTSFEHGTHRVLDGISLQLFDGENLGIVGRNGCGKTTILRIMAGIIPSTRGDVWIQPGKTAALLTLGLGFKPNLSGRDNAILAAMLQGYTRRQVLPLLNEIKEFSELGDSFEEPMKTYSSGMVSRLGFSTALMTQVDIMLIDETLSAGDAKFRVKAEKAIKQRIEGDQTVVFVSHSEQQIKSICSRAIWINGGKVAAEGPPEQVLKSYREHLAAAPG